MFKKNTIKKVLPVILAVCGIVVIIQSIYDTYTEAKKREQIIARWEEQLPEDHWIKNDIGKFNTFTQNALGIYASEFDMATGIARQTGKVGKNIVKAMKVGKYVWKRKYELRYADTGKKVTGAIKINPGESVRLTFYCGNDIQKFDITEEDFPYSYQLLVLACTEDTKIAVIQDGLLTANSQGKTLLQLYCDGEIWEYPVIVK